LLCARNASIHFLQTYQIRMLSVDDAGNAWQVELLVHADAHMNVIGHYAHRLRARRVGIISRRWILGDPVDQQREQNKK
jgi:hypothetical protein